MAQGGAGRLRGGYKPEPPTRLFTLKDSSTRRVARVEFVQRLRLEARPPGARGLRELAVLERARRPAAVRLGRHETRADEPLHTQ
ncbi:unnamed protein product, partial [Lampetra planeri]